MLIQCAIFLHISQSYSSFLTWETVLNEKFFLDNHDFGKFMRFVKKAYFVNQPFV